MKQYICIDIGGTSIKHGVITENGEFCETNEMLTEAMKDGGPGILKKIFRITEEYLKTYEA